MIIKDIDDKKRNLRLLVEEQMYNGKKYTIADSFAPSMDVMDKRISISTFNEDSINEYETRRSIGMYKEKISSSICTDNRGHSTTSARFTDGPLDLYDEIIEEFSKLIESGTCEFSDRALQVFEEFKNYDKKLGSVK